MGPSISSDNMSASTAIPLSELLARSTQPKPTAEDVAAAAEVIDTGMAPERNYWVWRLNRAIALMPLEMLTSVVLLEGASFFINKALLVASGIHIPALYAVAFVISMPLRRSVLPKLAVAMPLTLVLSRFFPALTRVHFSLVFTSMKQLSAALTPNFIKQRMDTAAAQVDEEKRQEAYQKALKEKDYEGARRALEVQPPEEEKPGKLMQLSDKYGLALWISYRMAGFVLINSVYLGLVYGVDISALIASWGYDVQERSVVATYAASAALSAFWFPAIVFLAPYPAEFLHRLRNQFFSTNPSLRKQRLFAPVRGFEAQRPSTDAATNATPSAKLVGSTETQQPQLQQRQEQQQSQQPSGSGSDASKSAALLLLVASVGGSAVAVAASQRDGDADVPAASSTASSITAAQSVTFRSATAADLPSIVHLLAQDELGSQREVCAASTDSHDSALSPAVAECYQRAWELLVADPNSEVLVGVLASSGAVVACLQLTCIPNLTLQGSTRALIEGVRVSPSLRGQQVGRALFAHAEQVARQRDPHATHHQLGQTGGSVVLQAIGIHRLAYWIQEDAAMKI
jgi:GNAT superfamily N-acetyltransferase